MKTIDFFNLLAPQLMIVCGSLMCLIGVLGNVLNICVFTLWTRAGRMSSRIRHSNRPSNCPLYLLVSSWSNLVVITYPLLTRIMFDGYQYQITPHTAFVFCKLRYFILHTCDLISLMCICLATFDRYLISSRNAYLRTLNTTKGQTAVLLVSLVLLIAVHSIPVVIYYDVSSKGQCYISSMMYSYYYLFMFQIVLHSFIPMIFLSVLGTLTYQQLRSLSPTVRHGDKQLLRMLILMSIAIILSSIPYGVEQFYYMMISNQIDRSHSSQVFLYHVLSSILFYVNPVTSFYVFFISTPNFRFHVRNLIRVNQHVQHYRMRHQILRQSIVN